MSGFIGLVNRDGRPVDRGLIERLTGRLAFRGPEGSGVWQEGPAGLGHTLLRATREAAGERQPFSIDGQVWLAADLRLDDRQTLRARLAGLGRPVAAEAPDVALLAGAYAAWGEACVSQLLGDFAFAVWDGPGRRLFCARDHFGVKPLYYAQAGGTLAVSNTLDAVRHCPGVPDELNDLAVADFLLFGRNQEVDTTVYAAVRRLPPGHTLTWDCHGLRVARWWSLPPEGEVRFRREQDYVERLRELLRQAVADRLRTGRAGVLMSGGIDSPLVAAIAREVGGPQLDLLAHTTIYDGERPDPERAYAALAAEHLGIPVHFHDLGRARLAEILERPELARPEPEAAIHTLASRRRLYERLAAGGPVVLTGFGGDPALVGSSGYAWALLREGAWGRLAVDLWESLRRGRFPGLGLRARLRRWRQRHRPLPPLPAWLSPDLAARLDLGARWRRFHEAGDEPGRGRRPEGRHSLTSPAWPALFESCDPGVTGVPVEVRHPLFDLRVLTYLLAVPAWPWCDNKRLLRAAAAGYLPEAIRRRPKAHFEQDPLREALGDPANAWVDRFAAAPLLARYVVRGRIPRLAGARDRAALRTHLLPLALHCWISQVGHAREEAAVVAGDRGRA